MRQKVKISGEQAFLAFYQDRFGDRWQTLYQALLGEHNYVELSDGLYSSYHIDVASLLAAQAMQVEPGMHVLDLCAAPGGKALVLAMQMQGVGSLTVNERSKDRFHRLMRNMALLKNPPLDGLTHTNSDARRYAMEHPGLLFDRVLLDAPCSSEAHVLKNPLYLQQWGLRRAKRLAIEQLAMLCQALELCKDGGKIVYSTCSLNSDENDGVIAKLLHKRPGYFTLDTIDLPMGEKTDYGWQIWPDKDAQGPMYISRLNREKCDPISSKKS